MVDGTTVHWQSGQYIASTQEKVSAIDSKSKLSYKISIQ